MSFMYHSHLPSLLGSPEPASHSSSCRSSAASSRSNSPSSGMMMIGSAHAFVTPETVEKHAKAFQILRHADDFHLHLRDTELMEASLEPLLREGVVVRAIIMPNLVPPVTAVQLAGEYRERILQCVEKIASKLQQEEEAAKRPEGTVESVQTKKFENGAQEADKEGSQSEIQAKALDGSSQPQDKGEVLIGANESTTPSVGGTTRQMSVFTFDSPNFTPLMTLYLTDHTSPQMISEAKASGFIYACKLYPKGATTHSNAGVTNLRGLLPTFQRMAQEGILLLIHGESTDPNVDIFDRESSFLPELEWVCETVPDLKIVLEHVTTRASIEFVKRMYDATRNRHESAASASSSAVAEPFSLTQSLPPCQLAATITPQHIMYNRNALFEGGLNPHHYCAPILKAESDRQALLEGIFSKEYSQCFFMGTDSAPHPRSAKEKSWGCAAGCFSAFAPIDLYMESMYDYFHEKRVEKLKSLLKKITDKPPQADSTDETHDPVQVRVPSKWTFEAFESKFNAFVTENGARFYGLKLNYRCPIDIKRQPWTVPQSFPFGKESVVPLKAGKILQWKVHKASSLRRRSMH